MYPPSTDVESVLAFWSSLALFPGFSWPFFISLTPDQLSPFSVPGLILESHAPDSIYDFKVNCEPFYPVFALKNPGPRVWRVKDYYIHLHDNGKEQLIFRRYLQCTRYQMRYTLGKFHVPVVFPLVKQQGCIVRKWWSQILKQVNEPQNSCSEPCYHVVFLRHEPLQARLHNLF